MIKYNRKSHRGVSSARNSGLRQAGSNLIAYLDSDNAWDKHYLLLMAARFVSHPEINTAYCALRVNDQENQADFILAKSYTRMRLMQANFIDLNIFMHRRSLFNQLGGFDERLTRLVDWELIIRYTRDNPPCFFPAVLAHYYISKELGNITLTESHDANWAIVMERHAEEAITFGIRPFITAHARPET